VQPTPDGTDLVISSAGHPRPYIVRGSGGVEEVDVRGTLLGGFADIEVRDHPVRLEPGDALVLYTDGVVEARVAGELFGDGRLRSLLATSAGLPAEVLAKRILQEVIDFTRGQQTDDIAVLVARAREPGDG
jgi:serine phosphatase RsbU (regulator of sigma subunit)